MMAIGKPQRRIMNLIITRRYKLFEHGGGLALRLPPEVVEARGLQSGQEADWFQDANGEDMVVRVIKQNPDDNGATA
jgi:antitoxin component of MazEF toxin-antitoxin module